VTCHVNKEDAWLACAPKTCCYAALVVPSGRDVWRIASTTGVPAWSFLRYFPSPSSRPDTFRLDQGDQTYRLALSKQQPLKKASPAPCIFLLRLRGGQHRCSLGQLRPASCRAFPSELVDRVLCVRNDAGCTCRVWTLADVDLADEAALVAERQAEAVEYHDVVSRWNATVSASAPGTAFDFLGYCDFVVAAYATPAAGCEIGP